MPKRSFALRRAGRAPLRGAGFLLALLLAGGASLGVGPARAESAAAEAAREPLRYRITTLAGREITPATEQGRVLVLNIWATWCAPCRQEMPALDAFYAKYRQRGVDVVAVSVDERGDGDAVTRVMEAYRFPAALALDSELKAFGRIRHVPATFVIDRDGVMRRNGWSEPGIVDLETLERAVKPLLAPLQPAQ